MRKIYISGPITGKKGYVKDFEGAEEELRVLQMESVNPVKLLKDYAETHTYEETMDECLKLLSGCDGIYMIEGWEHSHGAIREWEYAKSAGIAIRYQEILPRMPPEAVARDTLMDALITSKGYFTEKYESRAYRAAMSAFNGATFLYTLGREKGWLNGEDADRIFGGEKNDGLFKQQSVRNCREMIRREQKEENRIAIERILARQKE